VSNEALTLVTGLLLIVSVLAPNAVSGLSRRRRRPPPAPAPAIQHPEPAEPPVVRSS
jgi:rhamnose transport system permease protein